MNLRALLLIICMLVFVKTNAQRCGGGILTLELYTTNDSKLNHLEYELFVVSNEIAKDSIIYHKDKGIENYRLKQFHSFGVLLDSTKVNLLTKAPLQKKDIELSNKLIKWSKFKRKGKIKNVLEFKTGELVGQAFMLKMSSKDRTVHYLGNFFGGCNRRKALLWNKQPRFFRI